ncbi:MAG: hypothetical protein ACLQDV_24215 [Candidatus Binataceae bacterium]
MFDAAGDVAVVTGGNGDIGRVIALSVAEACAAIANLARNEEKERRRSREKSERTFCILMVVPDRVGASLLSLRYIEAYALRTYFIF